MTNPIKSVGARLSQASRARRATMFRRTFALDESTRLIDLGGGSGAHIHSVLSGTRVAPDNVYVADIDPKGIQHAREFGYHAVQLSEDGRVPFEDGFFDVVFCSSVIEHVTVRKDDVWNISADRFLHEALVHQREFADEIQRIGKAHWVQCPAMEFPFETHLWLPFVHWLPRPALLRITRMARRHWVYGHRPDYHLLQRAHMEILFPHSDILAERFLGLPKSWIAVRS